MSQEKVDRRKYEKTHRKQMKRKHNIITAISIVLITLVLGGIIGYPIGKWYYNSHRLSNENSSTSSVSDGSTMSSEDIQKLIDSINSAAQDTTTTAQ